MSPSSFHAPQIKIPSYCSMMMIIGTYHVRKFMSSSCLRVSYLPTNQKRNKTLKCSSQSPIKDKQIYSSDGRDAIDFSILQTDHV